MYKNTMWLVDVGEAMIPWDNFCMDKRTVLTLGLILAVIAAGFAFLIFNSSAQEAMQKNIEASVQDAADQSNIKDQPAQSNQTKGEYIDYRTDAIASSQGTKLIFFHAPWCPQCQDLDKDIKKQGVPDGYTIIKTDYDSNQELRKKYGVAIQTSIVKVDDAGNFIKKYVAYSEPTLDSVIKNLQ